MPDAPNPSALAPPEPRTPIPRSIWITWLACAVPIGWIGVYLAIQEQTYRQVIGAGFLVGCVACVMEARRIFKKRRSSSRSS